MRKNQKHLRIDLFSKQHSFQSTRTPRSPKVPLRDRRTHGAYLAALYQTVLSAFDAKRDSKNLAISPEEGIYLELTSFPNQPFPLSKLDSTASYKLKSVRMDGSKEVAVIFVPNSKRHTFATKVDQYLNPAKDNIAKDGTATPRNHDLIDSIASIRLADIRSFWTDASNKFPSDLNSMHWFELWLTDDKNNALNQAQALARRLNLTIRPSALKFHNVVVVLVRASLNLLESSIELVSCLEEVRYAKESPQIVMRMAPHEQREWAENLRERISLDDRFNVSVAVLDTGINYNNPILSLVTNQEWAVTWSPEWAKYTDDVRDSYHAHGSMQAGLISFGDLLPHLASRELIKIPYRVESGRILPPHGSNEPELYGAITLGTAYKLMEAAPNRRRVFSLAVTAEPEAVSGQPSSWSSSLDKLAWGYQKDTQQLIIVATGNNRDLTAIGSHLDQAHLSEIEDPAQAWNAITVGGYTELTKNDDHLLEGWEPWCFPGDLAPASRTSVNWKWIRQAPFKPDIVAEAGNRLISPSRSELADADCVSILTTSGRTANLLFDTTRDTSAATALVSRYAAILMCEYPHYWPETIRGLLVHSAEWTSRMLAQKAQFEAKHKPSKVAMLMLRTYGFGVPNVDRARYSADHLLTLVSQNSLHPFAEGSGTDAKLGFMHYYDLPWPTEALYSLPPETLVRLKITLSYFVEPNPGRKGYRSRYSYQSHGLRFEVKRPTQSEDNFRRMVNKLIENEQYVGPEGELKGWTFGSTLRTRGSLHSDSWEGSAAELAKMDRIAVLPVSGWWKFNQSEGRWKDAVRYSLIVSVIVPDEQLDIDIYTPVEVAVNAAVIAQTSIDIFS